MDSAKKRLSGATLKLDVLPGKSLGPFHLGQPLPDVLKILSKMKQIIPRIEFKYAKMNPLERDMLVQLLDHHIQFKFDAVNQKLKYIEITDFAKLELLYLGTTFSHRLSRVVPTFLQIYNTFGPTYPGEYDQTTKQYILNYPGISFVFPIPSQYAHLYSQKLDNAHLPLEFPDGTTPVCQKVLLYQGKGLTSIAKSPSINVEKFFSLKYYNETVTVKPHVGVYFESRKLQLVFGMDCQDVTADFGAPNTMFFKKDHKMLIHTDLLSRDSQDYFYNYFDYGFDVLFDGDTHQIKSIFLHTNVPGHLNFNAYRKCNFRVIVTNPPPKKVAPPAQPSGKGKGKKNAQAQAQADANGANAANGSHEAAPAAPAKHDWSSTIAELGDSSLITCDSNWPVIQEILGKPVGDPVIANRGSSLNPYGATRFYGYPGLIFEITETNHVASLAVYPE